MRISRMPDGNTSGLGLPFSGDLDSEEVGGFEAFAARRRLLAVEGWNQEHLSMRTPFGRHRHGHPGLSGHHRRGRSDFLATASTSRFRRATSRVHGLNLDMTNVATVVVSLLNEVMARPGMLVSLLKEFQGAKETLAKMEDTIAAAMQKVTAGMNGQDIAKVVCNIIRGAVAAAGSNGFDVRIGVSAFQGVLNTVRTWLRPIEAVAKTITEYGHFC